MRKLSLTILFLLCVVYVNAQSNDSPKKFWGVVELGYGWSISDQGKSYNMPVKWDSERMYLAHIRAKAGYYILPQFSLGVGLGLNGYYNTTINTFPVFVDLRYHLKSLPKLFAFADIGGSILSSGDFTSGFMTDLGVGYKIMIGKNFSLNPSLGYNLFKYSDFINEGRTRHTIYFQLGFEF